jgi:DNA-binding XRE family transcriptional regulator
MHNYGIKDGSDELTSRPAAVTIDARMSDDQKRQNRVQTLREQRLLSKAELARRSGLSVLTIDRVEKGAPCRVDTKRKIILALGLKVADRDQVFDDEEG